MAHTNKQTDGVLAEFVDAKTARKIKRVVDVRIECEPPDIRVWPHAHGSAEWWASYERQLKEWVDQFHLFIRDHRSQDPVRLSVVSDYQDQCSVCGCAWEPGTNDAGKQYCLGCGADIEIGGEDK